MELIIILFFLILVGTIVINSYKIVKEIIYYFFKNYINRHLLFRKLKKEYLEVLEKEFTYYQNLDFSNQKIFRRRLQKFISMKEFIPRGDLEQVTDQMKALIGGCAIQLTFGYPAVYFRHFYRIIVYPDNYYSEITLKYHKGEINTKGYIVLSWSNFVSGYLDSTDGINLGLHEMAHALKFENALNNGEYDFIDFEALREFNRFSIEHMEIIQKGDEPLLRSYAGENREEYFAIVVENFFERPSELKKHHPQLYSLTARVLNQDPLRL